MKRILLLCISLLALGWNVHSQNGLRSMGNGLQFDVLCSCTDSFGNVLAVSAISNDSIIVNRFDVGTRQWSFYTGLGKIYTSLNLKGIIGTSQRGTCSFYRGKFYFIGTIWSFQNPNTYFRSVMYEFNATWKKITEFKETTFPSSVECTKYKNDLYIVGAFDSIGITKTANGIALYNGVFFSNANFPGVVARNGYGVSVSFDTSRDTLFMATGSVVYYHLQGPLRWAVFYDAADEIESIACSKNYVYILRGNKLDILNNGSQIDTLSFNNPNQVFNQRKGKLVGTNNNLIIKNSSTLFQVNNRQNIRPIYNFAGNDTSINQVFLKYNNTFLYYHNMTGVINGSNDYNNIVEIQLDSIVLSNFDSVKLIVFRDYNKNYNKDTGDLGSPFPRISVNGWDYIGDVNGEFKYYPLDNEDADFGFLNENNPDTCYKLSFSGRLKSTTYKSQTSFNTLYFPLWRTSLQNRNLIVRAWGQFNERIADTTDLRIYVANRDCDQSLSAADVVLTLDPKTAFVSSVPAPFSKNNNTYTFKLNAISPNSTNTPILVYVSYPYGNYQLNDKVRHRVRIKTSFAEDTMDNTDSIVTKLVYSFDPNAKTCIPEGKVSKNVKKLRYRIDFQNEGTAEARNVIVVDTIDKRIPAYSFNMVAVSHSNYKVFIRDNIVTWEFKNINLQPKSVNEFSSKGYIIFETMLRSQLRTGDSILNKAAIYFDYNAPIITNHARIKIEESDITPQPRKENSTIIVFPNPTQASFHFENLVNDAQNLRIYDSKGALVGVLDLNPKEKKMVDVSLWTKGVYIVVTGKGKGFKIIVQ